MFETLKKLKVNILYSFYFYHGANESFVMTTFVLQDPKM